MSQLGKTIEIFLMDGDASGKWQADLSNWNCRTYKIPRNEINKSTELEGINSPGIYFLFGRDDESGKQFVYIGEGDNTIRRIMQPHKFEADGSYWTEAVIFVTLDGTLDKAKIKYLENRFHAIAIETERYIIKNNNTPTQSQLQNKTRDMLEEFIINARLVMLTLGYKVFEPQPSARKANIDDELLYFSRNNGRGGNATGKVEDGFWVLKGSYINPEIAEYLPEALKSKRKLYASDIDKNGILLKDICFGSPSYAAAFVCGKNSNGTIEWKDAKGRTLKELNGEAEETAEKPSKLGKKRNKAIKQSKVSIPAKKSSAVVDADILYLASSKFVAQAYMVPDGFLVKKGSQFAENEVNSCGQAIRNYRLRLIKDGSVKNCVFTRDVIFGSPSYAAACILGRNVNGKIAWKNKEGKTIFEMEKN